MTVKIEYMPTIVSSFGPLGDENLRKKQELALGAKLYRAFNFWVFGFYPSER